MAFNSPLLLALIGVVLIVGCKTTSDADDTCNAQGYQGLIGNPASAADAVPDPRRIYSKGDAVTQDFIPERVNIILDANGTITSINCG